MQANDEMLGARSDPEITLLNFSNNVADNALENLLGYVYENKWKKRLRVTNKGKKRTRKRRGSRGREGAVVIAKSEIKAKLHVQRERSADLNEVIPKRNRKSGRGKR